MSDTGACGTTVGYERHRALNEPFCGPCRLARNAYERGRRPMTATLPKHELPTTTRDELMRQVWIDIDTGCWMWRGATTDQGYGAWTYRQRKYSAHRTMYEQSVGPIPDGLQIDHLCRNRGCINPAHLEPVTAAENVRRAQAITHCKRGRHEYTPENTIIRKSGKRRCRKCENELQQIRRANKKKAI